jgi:hypothetical protein
VLIDHAHAFEEPVQLRIDTPLECSPFMRTGSHLGRLNPRWFSSQGGPRHLVVLVAAEAQHRLVPADLIIRLVIEPREFRIKLHPKRNDWRPVVLTTADDPIEMPEFGLRCREVDLYRGTPFDPERARPAT